MKKLKKIFSLILVVCLGMSVLLTMVGCQKRKALQDYNYTESDRVVELRLTNGESVRLGFGQNTVTVYDSYLYHSSVYEIAEFICVFVQEKGREISRTAREIAGEIKLHNLLYVVGYQCEHTKDTDVDYTADKRWYVNLASLVLG